MPQLTYQDQSAFPAIEGGLYDSGPNDILSMTPGANVAQVSNVLVATATNTSLYEIIINGVPSSYTSDGSATTPEIAAGLLAAGQANVFLSGIVTFSAGAGDSVDITADVAGASFVLAETDPGTDLTLSTPTANKTAGPIKFGRGLELFSTIAFGIALPSATSFVFEGISIARAKGRPKDNTVSPPVTSEAQYRTAEPVPTLRKGRIWVRTEDAITPASDVYLRHTANGALLQPGQFRSDADTANADDVSAFCSWLQAAGAGVLVPLDINLP